VGFQETEDKMIRKIKYAAAIGISLVLIPLAAVAQGPADQPASVSAAAVIPPDQQPTKEQLAKLFELMRLHQQVQSVLTMTQSMMQQQLSAQIKDRAGKLGSSLTVDQQAAIAKISDKYMQKAFNLFTIDELLDDMAGIYQRHISRSDVDAMIAFYSAPAGQHLLDAQPVILKEYMPVIMQRVQERSKALTAEEAKEMEEVTGSHMGQMLDAPPPPPPPPQPAK
jgi:hypothetical protein